MNVNHNVFRVTSLSPIYVLLRFGELNFQDMNIITHEILTVFFEGDTANVTRLLYPGRKLLDQTLFFITLAVLVGQVYVGRSTLSPVSVGLALTAEILYRLD